MKEHDLKCWPQYFALVESGVKPFEVRETHDRHFQIGDTLRLREWDPDTRLYSGKECTRRITSVLNGPAFGVCEGYAVLGLADDSRIATIRANAAQAYAAHLVTTDKPGDCEECWRAAIDWCLRSLE